MVQLVSRFRAASGAEALEAPPGCLAMEFFEDDDPAFVYLLTRWSDLASLRAWQAERPVQPEHEHVLRRRASVLDGVAASDGLGELTNELAVDLRENARQNRELERVKATLEATLEELRQTHWQIKKLQEVLPICMGCGFVNADERGWQEAIQFLKERAPFLSHGYCPECGARRRAEIDRELESL